MNSETIKQFLVGLSFGLDEASLAKFNKALASATLKVTALAATVKLAAAGIFYGISKISESFEKLGYELRLVSPALTKTLQLRQAMMYAYSKAGINIAEAAKQSILFNFSLAKTKFALEAIYKSVGLRFIPLLTKQMDLFRKNLYANMPKIQATLERFVKFIFKAFEAVVILGTRIWSMLGRVIDFFKALDQATDGWSTKVLGFIAVWKLLNLSFLATPLGLLLTGLVALLSLYDDYKTQQEGGQSLFDWTSMKTVIKELSVIFQGFFEILTGIFNLVGAIFGIFKSLLSLDFSSVGNGLKNVLSVFQSIGDGYIKSFQGIFGAVTALPKALSGFGFSPDVGKNGAPSVAPLGSQTQNSQTSQKVSQETNIIVQGSADANATGKAISSEQARVNFDMARNLKGATR